MPAEWEPHAATWLAWPHNADDWPGRFHPIPWVYCDIIRHLSRVEDVHLLVEDGAAEQRARGMLARTGAQLDRVHFHQWPTNRVWMRDSGPIFVTRAARTRCHHQLALQCLGKIRGLAAGRPASLESKRTASPAQLDAGIRRRTSRGPGRRQY